MTDRHSNRPAPMAGAPLPRLALLMLTGTVLAGCSTMRPTQKAFAPDEYTVRHPIRIETAQRHLDVFDTGRQMDRRQVQDLQEFARDYAKSGRGPIIAAVPAGSNHHGMMGSIRSALSGSGAHAPLQITTYQPDMRLGAAPVRLSFARMEARLASQCGQWPDDLAGTRDLDTWQNRPHYNLGCAYQSMLAAQVADPIDLVRPRVEGQVDTVKRTKDIEALRKDQDPSTQWRKDDVKVKEAQQ